jgi:hypothetical protein
MALLLEALRGEDYDWDLRLLSLGLLNSLIERKLLLLFGMLQDDMSDE